MEGYNYLFGTLLIKNSFTRLWPFRLSATIGSVQQSLSRNRWSGSLKLTFISICLIRSVNALEAVMIKTVVFGYSSQNPTFD